jgi:hypothetical protein
MLKILQSNHVLQPEVCLVFMRKNNTTMVMHSILSINTLNHTLLEAEYQLSSHNSTNNTTNNN